MKTFTVNIFRTTPFGEVRGQAFRTYQVEAESAPAAERDALQIAHEEKGMPAFITAYAV